MARHLVAASSQYLWKLGVPVSTPPLTLSIWVKMTTTAAFCGSLSFSSGSLWFTIGGYTGVATAYEFDGAVHLAQTSAIPAGVWTHLCAVFPSNASRSVFLNGANKVTTSSSATQPAILDVLSVGTAWFSGAPFTPMWDGDLAEFAIYNDALTDAEVAQLAGGLAASGVRPANLKAYYPMLGTASPEPDAMGGTGLTLVNGPTAAPHPPITTSVAGGRMLLVF